MKRYLFILTVLFSFISSAQLSDFDSIDFITADNVATINEGMSLNHLPILANKLTSKLDTDVEKFRAIYMWVCNNISVDANQANKVKSKRKKFKNDSVAHIKWNDNYSKTAFQKLLKQKKTMCTGYAYLIKELCTLANIECKIVDGYARTADSNSEQLELANHSWNAVKLNNKWYLCDAIWASGYTDSGRFIKDYNNGYFLTDPKLFAMNHYPLNKTWLLNDTLINSEFKATPIVYGETFEHNILPVYPKNMKLTVTKKEDVSFSFKSPKLEGSKIELVYYLGPKEQRLEITYLKTENGLTTFTTNFKITGFYDVHLKFENDIVASYVVNVKRS
jgi:transglutaminase/protease-like cytokinesis protein 3